jgi:regulatory protein spx
MARRVIFYQWPLCAACRRARHWLDALGDVEMMEHDILRDPPPASLLERHVRGGEAELRRFLDSRSGPYRRLGLARELPGREDLLRLMREEPGLIRRPVVVRGREAVFGFDEAALRSLLG